ncbi:Factor arrest protein 11 [Friedmanniomyces endolithicus]|nr:Factor arrest protein 11 [Friedmanniomyces endolithicus]KAK1024362.1 Factor arrest protein 11 [Friedmanniomyces endolithicus]
MDEVENPDLPAAGESSPTLRPIDQDDNEDFGPGKPGIDAGEDEEPVDSANPSPIALPAPRTNARLPLNRESSIPPPQQLPPAPPAQSVENGEFPQDSPDSLTLADLKRIRSAFPNAQAPPKQPLLDDEKVYDFEYEDAQSLPVEVEEWFTYSDEEEVRLRKCKAIFNQVWRAEPEHGDRDWLDVTEETRRKFVRREVQSLRVTEGQSVTSLMMLVYLGLGVWEETAGRQEGCALEDLFPQSTFPGSRLDEYRASGLQIQWIVAMVDTLHECDGLKVVYECLRSTCEESFASSPGEQTSRNEAQPKRGEESMELWCCLTLMYLFVEVARTTGGTTGKALKRDILALEPKLMNYFTQIVSRLRWDDVAPIPLTKMLLLAWKTILVTFGGLADVEKVKLSLRAGEEEDKDKRGQPVITASPLDYHLFRQEINSKYPAYQPPPPIFPLEPEHNSILPPLRHRRSSFAASDTAFISSAPAVGTHSILHQPVHIATPAPSPPPSPAGPGKAGKKQNYQTNQNFPFLYPPLDERSSELGGKGNTSLQDALVGRKWEGSDVPASILEAAELFAQRMRATRAMKQMWETRVAFMKFERGWKVDGDDEVDVDVDEFELVPKPTAPEAETAAQGEPLPQTEEQKKLVAVGEYYRDSLPHMQSVVIVSLKAVLQNVMDLTTKNNGQNGLQPGIQFNEANGMTNGSTKPLENGVGHNGDSIENTAEEIDRLRTQEIAGKAISGILLLLLKWFKVSHVLQHECLTQLLLDSNYVPLSLKYWQMQEIGRACHYRVDGEESGFFYFCQTNSRQGPPPVKVADGANGTMFEESEDEAAPPPIKRTRDQQGSDASANPEDALSPTSGLRDNPMDDLSATHPPEVDELGYPTAPIPTTPLKNYSWRNLFTSINYLRILQKVTRRKTHRALLLISYKSSDFLRKTLRIPVQPLRYYTLKLFKTQVPFCGRKWRQGNMKIITAVWLSVPAELRDDWLSGGGGGMGGSCVIGDVDGTVEDALPLEQAVRSLTHWWNVRNFPEMMGVSKGMLEEEADFFARELGRMGVPEGEEEGAMEEMGYVGTADEVWRGPIEGY